MCVSQYLKLRLFLFALIQNVRSYYWQVLEVSSQVDQHQLLNDDGHHHLIIDADLPNLKLPIPANSNYVHFGLGQTETTLTLDTGTHTLRLLMGNYLHIPHDDPIYSKEITITVK